MARLQVKVDHIATLREARRSTEPDPVVAAAIAEMAGADGITVHLRSDRRHIKERDLELLKHMVKSRLSIEMAPIPEMVKIAQQTKPHQVTLLPERPGEITTETGMDAVRNRDGLIKHVSSLKEADIQVCLFIDPDIEQVKAAHKMDVDSVQFNLTRFGEAKFQVDRFHAYNALVNASKAASKLNLGVMVGRGLDYRNAKDLRLIPEIDEYVVGFAIMARAMIIGLNPAIREMLEILR